MCLTLLKTMDSKLPKSVNNVGHRILLLKTLDSHSLRTFEVAVFSNSHATVLFERLWLVSSCFFPLTLIPYIPF